MASVSTAPPKTLLSVDDFWDFVHRPGNADRHFELIRGEVVEVSRPTRPHGRICARLTVLLERYAEVAGRGYPVSNDSGVILEQEPATVVGPDVAFYTDAATFDEVDPKWGDTPPVLAVEVLSPSDKFSRVIAKIEAYLSHGVPQVWLVDYEERTVSVFRANQSPRVLTNEAELTGGDELPGFSCRVAELFCLPGESAPATKS